MRGLDLRFAEPDTRVAREAVASERNQRASGERSVRRVDADERVRLRDRCIADSVAAIDGDGRRTAGVVIRDAPIRARARQAGVEHERQDRKERGSAIPTHGPGD